MEYAAIRWWLENYGGPKIKKYEDTVITDTRLPIIGIPMRELRQYAKKLSGADWRCFLRQARYDTFEEVLLLGMTVAYAKEPFSGKVPELRQLLPYLDSWAHTDSIVPTLKPRQEELEAVWDFAMECLERSPEYTVRFGIILLLDYFLTTDRVRQVADLLTDIRDERYYVRMAAAWCTAEIAVKYGEMADEMLKSGQLDPTVQNMAIRKIRESYRVPEERKAFAATMKRKDI